MKESRIFERSGQRRRRLGLACLLVLTLGSRTLLAEPSPTELAVARRSFEEAVKLEGEKRWADARGKLGEALAVKETPGLRFHLGYCAEQLGELVAALIEYERALDLIRGGARAPDVLRLAEPARARVQARVAELTLRLPADAADAEVVLDGRRLSPAVLGKPAPIDPGPHQLRVKASDDRTAQLELQLREGEQRTVHVVLRRKTESAGVRSASPAPPSQQPSAPPPGAAAVQASAGAPAGVDDRGGIGAREIVLIGEGTAALVGLGVGVGYLVVRSNERERVEAAQREVDALAGGTASDSCASADFPGQAACGDLEAAIDDYDRAGVIATVGFVTAGVAGTATALTFLLWKPEERPALSLGPGPGGRGLALRGAF